MHDVQELYQALILDHGRQPRHHHACATATHSQAGHNPLCGDRLTVYLQVNAGQLDTVCFQGEGCAISMASASLMAEALQGRSVSDAKVLFEAVHTMLLTGKYDDADQVQLGKLAVLVGVTAFPMRIKCASLAWHALHGALASSTEQATVTTE